MSSSLVSYKYKFSIRFFTPSNVSRPHSVAVVGYGTDSYGWDFWLIKNSWGSSWGEGGFIRLKRGVRMCNIGKVFALPICQKVGGATSAPLTTSEPCVDKSSKCPELAKTNCKQYGSKCAKVRMSINTKSMQS